ncbi:monocarboxylate transporter 14 isoform X2 [Lingula anatina]|nr:monocarboxylate transporter 14 isoform X2 [Lingula anatina]|eukprot:XP_013401065.1 monocarboxylate transporter 14 isoform X2 [Lingula anatina]
MFSASPNTAVLEILEQDGYTNGGFNNDTIHDDNPDSVEEGHDSEKRRELTERSTEGESTHSDKQRRLSCKSAKSIGSVIDSRRPSVDTNSKVPTDRCIDWLVVLASFFIHFIVDGIMYSFGVLYIALLNEFEESKLATSWVGSIQIAVSLIIGPIASALSEKFGHRAVGITGSILAAWGFGMCFLAPNLSMLYISYGVMTGLGFGLMYFPSIVSVQHHFEKKKSLAMGVAMCGSGVGTFSMAPLLELLIESITWRYTLLVLAGLSLSGIGLSMLFFPPTLKSKEENETKQNLKFSVKTDMSLKNLIHIPLLREADVVVWLVCMLMFKVGVVVPHTYIPDAARAKGIEVNNAAFLVSIVGIANTVARVVMGLSADFRCANRRYMVGTSVIVGGVMVSILPFMMGYGEIATVCAFYGLTVGATVSLVPVVLRDLVGIEKLGPSYGLHMLATGLGSLLLSAGGSLYDLTGSYDVTFYITGSLVFLAGGSILLLPWVRKLQDRCCYHGSAKITTDTEPSTFDTSIP